MKAEIVSHETVQFLTASASLRTPEEGCVLSHSRFRLLFIVVVIAISTATTGAWPHKQGQKAQVRFVATSTLIRGTWGPNEDTYLAELTFKNNETQLIRLVDSYPNEAPPIARKVLTSDVGTVFSVKRDAGCDRPFGQVLLRTAPGDPMAVLPERTEYKASLDRTPTPGTILPCYRALRR
jgi:hypothetical protein